MKALGKHVLASKEEHGEIVIGVALERGLARLGACVGLGHQHDLAPELAAPLGEVGGAGHRRDHHFARHGAVGRGCPGDRDRGQLDRAGRGHPHARAFDPPAAPERETFLVDVRQAPFAELCARPVLRLAHARRIGQPRADLVGQIFGGRHHLAVVEAFVDDPVDHRIIGRRLRRGGNDEGDGRDRGDNRFAHER